MNIKDDVLACGSFNINDVTKMRFWKDMWAASRPFKDIYPTIYSIAHYPHASVASVMG